MWSSNCNRGRIWFGTSWTKFLNDQFSSFQAKKHRHSNTGSLLLRRNKVAQVLETRHGHLMVHDPWLIQRAPTPPNYILGW
jgi:hypothetical protein